MPECPKNVSIGIPITLSELKILLVKIVKIWQKTVPILPHLTVLYIFRISN
jgi:hypothetical protein